MRSSKKRNSPTRARSKRSTPSAPPSPEKSKRSDHSTAHHEVRIMRLKELEPAPYNPRTISDEAARGLEQSLARFGLVQPIVFNKRSGYVVGGHQRLAALKRSGKLEGQTIVVDLNHEDERALNITLNNPHVSGEFSEGLQILLEELKNEIPDAFTDLRLDQLLDVLIDPDDIEEDEAPPLPEKPKTKKGDLIRLGDHILLCGDSCAPTDIERLIKCAGSKVDMVFTDPPYGVNFGKENFNPRAKQWDAIKNDEKSEQDLYDFSSSWVASILIAAKDSAPVYIWTAPMESGYEIYRALKDGGIHIQSQIIWVKNLLVLGQCDYQWRHEICWYGWTEGTHHFWNGGRALTSVWEFSKDAVQSYVHPMQKPVALAAHAIQNSCVPGGSVLDLFAGSGSTLMACEQIGRRFIGIEIDERYCDVIIKRWENATGKKAL